MNRKREENTTMTNALSETAYTPEETICVSFLDILEHLPAVVSEHRYPPNQRQQFVRITHVTIHQRKAWNACSYGQEQAIAFHAEGDDKRMTPFERLPNSRGVLAHTITSVPVWQAHAWGIYTHRFDNPIRFDDDSPVVKRATYALINY